MPVVINLEVKDKSHEVRLQEVPRRGEWVEIDGVGYLVQMVIHDCDTGAIIVRVRG